MGLREDLDRFQEIGENSRMDLEEFIKHGQLGENIQIPIKIVQLPEFVYDDRQSGGIGQADEGQDPQEGDPVEFPDEGDEAGDQPDDPGYYDMDPEEFAEELDDELGLQLDPKGKSVVEEKLGDMVEMAQSGPRAALDFDYMYKQGLKRQLALWYDEEWLREACKIEGKEPVDIFRYARSKSIPVGLSEIETVMEETSERAYDSIEHFEEEVRAPRTSPRARDIEGVAFREDDERYRHPEIVEEKQKNVVVVNIRDVSGSMGKDKRDLVERVFQPMDWYLQGKYEQAEFIYIAHNAQAWEEDRDEFFGMESGGGTIVSEAYSLAQDILENMYPWSQWNRYVFAAGDGDNIRGDSEDNVVPLVSDIDANMHAYIEVKPRQHRVKSALDEAFTVEDGVVTEEVNTRDDVIPTIEAVLREASHMGAMEDTS